MAFPDQSQGAGTQPVATNAQQMGHPAANPQSVAAGGRSVYGGKPMVSPPKPFTLKGDDGSVTSKGTGGTISTDAAEGVGGVPVDSMGSPQSPMSGV